MIPRFERLVADYLGKPRASGDDPGHVDGVGTCSRVNPARAGMIPMLTPMTGRSGGKPRASGDDPAAEMARRAEAE